MYYLTHTAVEIDEKLKRVPLATASESEWVRTDDWCNIADQIYNSESSFAQSGVAVAAAIESATQAIDKSVDEKLSGFSIEAEVDQEYSSVSKNAQSGTAVAGALAKVTLDILGEVDNKLTNLPAIDMEAISDEEIEEMFSDDE